MRVSTLNLGAPGALSGLSTASESLATTYALSVDADGVIQPASRKLQLGAGTVRKAVSGTPVPASPVFLVTARSNNDERSRLIANTVAQSLVDFVARQSARVSPEVLLRRYETQSRLVNRAQVKVTEAQSAFNDSESNANARKLADARSDLQTAELERTSLQSAYSSAASNSSPSPRVQVLRQAATASSDPRTSCRSSCSPGCSSAP